MIDLNDLRARPGVYKEAARVKRITGCDVDLVLKLDEERRALLQKVELMRAERKQLAKVGGQSVDTRRAEGRALGERLAALEEQLEELNTAFQRAVLFVPSIPGEGVPVGAADDDNVELRRFGAQPTFAFEPRDHVELAKMHDWLDFDGPREFVGSRAYALKGDLALLEMALMRFAVDFLIARGYQLVVPPLMVQEKAMTGTGYFPLGEENAYTLERDALWLIGTSEVALAAMQMNKTFEANKLPLKLAGLSACFRREAGAAGRDTRGLYRVHQFQKVEQVIFCAGDDEVAAALHAELLGNSEALLQKLELPYRVVAVCTGELGLGQVRKHDIETWMPSRNSYGETHSCSTLGDFQARRLNAKYSTADGGKRFCYTLNNTALASPRILIPFLECHQQQDGTVRIPEALRPYLFGLDKLPRNT